MSEPVVTIAHLRAATLGQGRINCAAGVRPWFARHGLDYRRFVRQGLPASAFAGIEDAFVTRAIALAARESAHV